jgi:SAM-dependent methyltransferase
MTPGPSASEPDPLSAVAALYTRNIDEHGRQPLSVGWRDAGSQLLRFRQLALLITADPDAPPTFTVNDLGCGYGAMFSFLDAEFGARLERYRGYEISNEMLSTARGTIRDPRAEFVATPRVDAGADYTFVSGTFHVKLGTAPAEWEAYVRRSLLEIGACSKRGFAFNLLTNAVDWRDEQLYYADPAEYLRFCRSRLSRRVVLLHDYPLHEWTMIVRAGEPAP